MERSSFFRIALVLLLFFSSSNSWPRTATRYSVTATRLLAAAEGKGFGPPQKPPTLEEFVEKEEAKKRNAVKRSRYKAAKELAKTQPSLHKMLGAVGENKIPDQKKQGHGGF